MSTVGVGFDLVDVDRFAALLARRPRLYDRIFTAEERVDGRDQPERLAARFAAKEATWKALGVGLGATGLHDVQVHRDPSGEPQLRLSGAAQRLAAAKGVTRWHLSMTHTAHGAGAVVIGSAM